jgi:hypothetical protein
LPAGCIPRVRRHPRRSRAHPPSAATQCDLMRLTTTKGGRDEQGHRIQD